MKSFDNLLEPDERYRIIMVDDPAEGIRPITLADHYDMAASLKLPTDAPETVNRLYGRALNALVYGWFDYELMVVATGQALACLEYALKERIGPPAEKLRGLGPRLQRAVSEGLLTPPEPTAWGKGDTAHTLLVEMRNEIAHGSDHVYYPTHAATIFGECRRLICGLYGLPIPS